MGQRLAHVVELPVLQWSILELVVGLIISSTALTGGVWQYVLWLWLSIAWTLLGVTYLFRNKLIRVLYLLSHEHDGEPLLYKPDAPADSPETSPRPTGMSTAGSGVGSGSGMPASESTPLQPPVTKGASRKSFPEEIKNSPPRSLHADAPRTPSCPMMPRFLKGQNEQGV